MESLKYDSATYADLVASQLQEERYATWVYEAQNSASEKDLKIRVDFFCSRLFFFKSDLDPNKILGTPMESNASIS